MSILQVLTSAFLVMLFVFTINSEKEVQSIYVKGVRCNISSIVFRNFSCFAKSYNRTFSTINAFLWFKEPINTIFFEVRLFYKYGTIYREVMHTPRVDWCQLMKASMDNLMIATLLSMIRDSAPYLLQECPYSNITLKDCNVKTRSIPSLIPAGDYKMIFYMLDKQGETIAVGNIIGSMVSPLKESFG